MIQYSTARNGMMMKCNRGQRYKPKHKMVDEDGCTRTNTRTRVTGCQFHVKVRRAFPRVALFVIDTYVEYGRHNHAMAFYDEWMFVRGLSDQAKKIIKTMSISGARPAAIVAYLRNNIDFQFISAQKVYNYRQKLRREGVNFLDGNGPIEIVRRTIAMAKESNYFVVAEAIGADRELGRIFFAHPEAIRFFRAWHIYIGADTTYKTNQYKMPLLEFIGMTPTNQNFQIGFALLPDETCDSYV